MTGIFLTSLDILDTGYLTKAKSTTQLSSSYRVNSGTALRLKGVEIEVSSGSNIDVTSIPGKFSVSSVPVISINPREIKLTIAVNTNNTSTSNDWGINDASLLPEILRLPETLGIKAIYYPVDDTATGDTRGRAKQLVYNIGTADTTEPQTGLSISLWNGSAEATGKNLTNVKYLPVRFNKCTMPQKIDNIIEVVLDGVITI